MSKQELIHKSGAPYPLPATSRMNARDSRTTLLLCAVLLGLSSAAFYPVIHSGLINLDDPAYVALNSHVQQGLTRASIAWAFTTVAHANWHPVTWLSHMLDYQLFGERVWGHHLSSLVLHCLNTLALFLVLRRLTGGLWRSFVVAALFGVHPLRVESVAWVAERKDVLSGFFFLLTLGAYTRFVQIGPQPLSTDARPHDKDRAAYRRWGWYCAALALLALGLMSKPMLVTLPFVLLLLDFWPLGRLASKDREWDFRLLTSLVIEKVPFFGLSITCCMVTLIAQRSGGIVVSSGGNALLERVENALVSYCRYLGKLFVPVKLAVFYPLPAHWPGGTVVLAGLVLLAVSALAIWMWRGAPYLAVGWLWFLGTLVPVIGLVQVGWQAIADRYTYIPSIGVLLMVVWGVNSLAAKWPLANSTSSNSTPTRLLVWPVVSAAAAAALILSCFFLTRQQVAYWKDSESLFRHTLAVTENNAFAHETLGLALRVQGRLDESSAEMREAIVLNPNYAEARRDLGYNLIMKGDLQEGTRLLETALRQAPYLPRTHKQLGIALQRQGKLEEALAQFQAELKINPTDAEAHNGLGATLLSLGRLDGATAEFHAAVRWDPAYAEPHSNLGIALCRAGHLPEGIAEFERALVLNPDYAQAHNNLGVALVRAGRREEAITHFKEALRIRPNYPGAAQQLQALTGTP